MDGKQFDEAAFRADLIARGTAPETATTVAARTAAGRAGNPIPTKASMNLFSAPEPSPASAKLVKPKAPAKKPINAPAKPASKKEQELIQVGAEILGQPATGSDFAFVHTVLCQVGLPRSKVDGDHFMRQSGAAWVNVQAGYLDEGRGPVQQPVPYGPMPRLALAWVSSYSKRHGTREIPIGDSAAEFLRLMGMDAQGARYTTLRKQTNALAACRLQLGYKGRTYNGQPVEQFDAWQSNAGTGQRSLWPGVMVLSEHYFRELAENAVPLDNRALHALKGSALALDIYTWLAHRLYRMNGETRLYWLSLRGQFGQEYIGKNADKDFKTAFLLALRAVLVVYPQAVVEQIRGGLRLKPSPPPIAFKG